MRIIRIQDVCRGIACILLSLLVSNGAISAEAGPAEIAYDITVRIDPVARTIEGRSVITASTPEELTLMLGRRFETMHARVDAAPLGPSATTGRMRAWRISGGQPVPRRIVIHWRGEFSALDTSLDHPQTLGRDEPASSSAGTFCLIRAAGIHT